EGGLALQVAEEEVLLAAEEGGAAPGREPAAGLERRFQEDGVGEGVLAAGGEVPGVLRHAVAALRLRSRFELPLRSGRRDDAVDGAQGRRREPGYLPARLDAAVVLSAGGYGASQGEGLGVAPIVGEATGLVPAGRDRPSRTRRLDVFLFRARQADG